MASKVDDLRALIWPSRKAALAELERQGLPQRGDDYELREVAKGDWRLMPLADVIMDAGGSRKKAAGDKPKAGARAKSPRKQAAEPSNVDEPAAPEDPQEAASDPAQESGRSMEQQAPAPLPASPDYGSVLPAEAGPYELVIREGEAAGGFPAFSAHTWAIEVARRYKWVVHIRNAAGEIVRSVDPAKLSGRRAAAATTPRRGGPPRAPRKLDELAVECVRLAKRKNGVKRTELSDLNGGVVLNWKQKLMSWGKRDGLVVEVNRDGETPVYWLVPE